MKRTNIFKVALGFGILMGSLTIDLGSTVGFNLAGAQETTPTGKSETSGKFKCPDGSEEQGTWCLVGNDDCTPTIKCN